MEDLFLGLSLVFIFALCYFAVSRFGRRMEKSCKDAAAEQKPEPPAREESPVVLVAADSRLLGRLRRETEREKINLM